MKPLAAESKPLGAHDNVPAVAVWYPVEMSLLDQALNRTPPELLFHYTSFSGLLGILQSRQLWASNIHYLNDEVEFALGLQTARAVVDQVKTDATDLPSYFFDALLNYVNSIRRADVFVFSLTEADDLLSQWRGYCPAGKGVSVGFLSAALIQRAVKHDFRLVPAIYDAALQWQILEGIVRGAIESFRSRSAFVGHEQVAGQFASELTLVAPLLKHSAFSEEREWRLVSRMTSTHHPRVRIREGAARLVPYYEFSLCEPGEWLSLGRVTVGSAPNLDLALNSVQELLAVNKVRSSDGVVRSAIPYRSW